jgi:probable F420-dependent oxidoreductase
MSHTFRFGLQISSEHSDDPVESARRAEDAGFDIVLMGDHIGPESSPLLTLAAIANATTSCRIGTLVINADVRNPVQLAWEAVTLDHLSGGRFELGMGAGHTPQEYSAMGIPLASGKLRKRRLADTVEVVRRLVDGKRVDFEGEFFQLEDAYVGRSIQDRLPLLVGGNGEALLGHAGAHADIIGLQGLGRTLEDGHRHSVRWSADWLDEQVEHIRAGAGERHVQAELNALVQVVQVTNDRRTAIESICERVPGLTPEDATTVPYVLLGSVGEIVEQLERCRERWGISYFAVRDLDAFRPVIDSIRSHQ